MNLLLLHPTDLTETSVATQTVVKATARITDERLLHLRKVLRSKPGDRLRAGLLNGPIGEASVLSIDRSHAQLAITLDESPPPPLGVDLLLALPRPKFLGRILQHATTLGVKHIVLFQSARVEKSYWSSNLLAKDALHRHLLLGLEQGRDTVLPKITVLRSFAELLEVAREATEQTTLLIADGNAQEPFPRQSSGLTSLVVGPEGGLLDREIDRLRESGGVCASLGDRPLRVETAVAACLSRLLP